MAQQQVTVGKIGAVYGIKGWLKITSFTDNAENIFDYTPWILIQGQQQRQLDVVDWKRHNKGLIAKFAGIDDRDMAATLTGATIAILAQQLPELPDDEYYWRELIGMAVENEQGYHLGTVSQLMETGANDVLVVRANSNDAYGKQERLIPFVEERFVKQVDKASGIIRVDWDPGF